MRILVLILILNCSLSYGDDMVLDAIKYLESPEQSLVDYNLLCNKTNTPSQQSNEFTWLKCKNTQDPLFVDTLHHQMDIEIKTDFTKINGSDGSNNKHNAKSKGIISYTGSKGGVYKIDDVTIKAGGHTRFWDDYRPLRIKFDSNNVSKWNLFKKAGKVKFIPPRGMPPKQHNKEALFFEYYLYKILNILGFPSYNVRLANLTEFDIRSNKKTKMPVFIMESKKDLARRCGLKRSHFSYHRDDDNTYIKGDKWQSNVGFDYHEGTSYLAKFAKVLFMDGDDPNQIKNGKNVTTFLEKNNSKKVAHPVAHDFDMSGIINGGKSYVDLLPQSLKMVKNDKRFEPLFNEVAKRFKSKKSKIKYIIDSSPHLTNKQKEIFNYWINKTAIELAKGF